MNSLVSFLLGNFYLATIPSVKKLNHQKFQKAQFINRISKLAYAQLNQFTGEKEVIICILKIKIFSGQSEKKPFNA